MKARAVAPTTHDLSTIGSSVPLSDLLPCHFCTTRIVLRSARLGLCHDPAIEPLLLRCCSITPSFLCPSITELCSNVSGLTYDSQRALHTSSKGIYGSSLVQCFLVLHVCAPDEAGCSCLLASCSSNFLQPTSPAPRHPQSYLLPSRSVAPWTTPSPRSRLWL